MADQIQVRRDTASNWTSNDPTLAAGELGYETDTTYLKVGDGSTAWSSLGYAFKGLAGLAVTDGNFIVGNGTSFVAETGATARTSLGLAIGTDVQAYDSNLTSFVSTFTLPTSDGSANQILKTNGSGTLSFTDDAGGVDTSGTPVANDFARFTDADTIEGRSYSEVRSDLGLVIGTNVQAYDAQLADVAGLAVTDGGFIVGDGSNFVLETGATARTSLGVAIGTDVLAHDANLQSFVTTFTLPTSDGSANQVLKTDGSATLSFVDQSGGVDTSGTPAANDFARFTDADTIEGRSYAEVKADLSLEIGTDVLAYDSNLQSFVTPFTLPTSDGTANQLLKTNGSATLGFTGTIDGGSSS